MPFGFLHRYALSARPGSNDFATRRPAERQRGSRPVVERLDARQLLAAAVPTPDVTMLAASTTDSQSVTITYDVRVATGSPVELGFYRSTNPTFSADDVPVESVVALPSVDSAGNALGAVGVHKVTVPISGGLPLNPAHPYVLAVANPTEASAADPAATASFRTYTIGVITHGGIQDPAWKNTGVPWTNEMAKSLLAEGYDKVIPFNWVNKSSTIGAAPKEAPRLTKQILAASSQFPTGSPVDIQFIGHSEGTVVNTQAIAQVAKNPTPQLAAGYWEDTLLDPHAANADVTGRQYSTSGLLGPLAKMIIDNYQSRAKDPLVYVPARVNESQVFYQQTPAYHDHNENLGIYNLWGQVPVKGDSVYYNLTPAGIVHGGKNGVYSWYQNFVVPTLGDGASGLKAATLTASAVTTSPTTSTSSTVPVAAAEPTYAGTAEPGSPVLIRISHTDDNDLKTVARTTADANGNWLVSVDEDNIPAGRYRVVAVSKVTGSFAGKRAVMGVVPLGPLVLNQTYGK